MTDSKVPPHSEQAEKSVLGAILLDKDAIVQISEFLLPEHFYAQKHGDIYAAMLALFELREPIDLVTLPQKLKEQKRLKTIGGVGYLSGLVDGVPSSANIKHYGEIIRDYSTRRRLISDGAGLVESAFDEGEEIASILDKAEQTVFALSQKHMKQGFVPLKSVLADSFDRLDELTKNAGSLRGVETGFADLDKTLAGLQNSNLIILAARPGTGKCVTGDTWMVDPATGERVRMDEFVKDGKRGVLSLNTKSKLEQRQPEIYLDDGVKPVWEVTTSLGNKIKATAVHPLLILDGWKKVEELEVGERIGVPRELGVFGKKSWDEHKVRALAYFLGDGCLTNASPRFTNSSKRVHADFADSLRKYIESKGITQNELSTKLGVTTEDASVNTVTKWLSELGLMGKNALQKSIPGEVFTLKKSQLSLFLNRLYACDGSVVIDKREKVEISYASSSYELAEQVKHLLIRYGIIAKLRTKNINYKEGRVAYEVVVTGASQIERFANNIGIFDKEKRMNEALVIGREKMGVKGWTKDTLPVSIWKMIDEDRGEMSWAELARRLGKNNPGANLHVGKGQPRRDTVLEIAKVLKSQRLLNHANSEVYWDTIVSIEYVGKENVYDLTVPELHNFVAGDMLVHNTAFALNMAQYASVVKKVSVGFFSLEMSKEELVDRMLVAQADIDAWRLKTGKLTSTDFEKLSEAMGVLAEAPLYIDDTPGISILEMRTKARRLKSEHDLGLIIVDYLQLMKGRNLENRVQEVGEISQGLKNLARELKVPVLSLSQLSRAVEHRGSKQPQLSDLRESGSIEQDADVVMFLYREDDEDLSNMKLNIAKHRNGALRTIDLRFRGERVRFYGAETSR